MSQIKTKVKAAKGRKAWEPGYLDEALRDLDIARSWAMRERRWHAADAFAAAMDYVESLIAKARRPLA